MYLSTLSLLFLVSVCYGNIGQGTHGDEILYDRSAQVILIRKQYFKVFIMVSPCRRSVMRCCRPLTFVCLQYLDKNLSDLTEVLAHCS